MPISGHAPGHVRDTFLAAVEAFGTWRRGPQPTVEFEVDYKARRITLSEACTLVWNCTDIMPGDYFDLIAELGPKSRTYAAAARSLRKHLAM
jgi:hypothetical protein